MFSFDVILQNEANTKHYKRKKSNLARSRFKEPTADGEIYKDNNTWNDQHDDLNCKLSFNIQLSCFPLEAQTQPNVVPLFMTGFNSSVFTNPQS